MKYRPELDGIRAIAVLAVIAYHLHLRQVQSGYMGVDVFFVLSGFLITKIYQDRFLSKSISIFEFYKKRIARIFPASTAVILVTLAAGFFIYSEQDVASLSSTSAFAMVSLANVKFYLLGDYFQVSNDTQPLLHFWTLAVEEQFYIIYPPLLMLVARFTDSKLKLRKVLLWLAGISFLASLGLTFVDQKAAFYLLPSRAWELLAGAVIATLPAGLMKEKPAKLLSGWMAVLLLAVLVVPSPAGLFPAPYVLLPVAIVAALILALEVDSPVKSLLSAKPMQLIGKLSYSLYLWHWVVFSLVDYSQMQATEATRITLKIVLTIALSVGSYYLIEQPLRRSLGKVKRTRHMVGAVAVLAAVMVYAGLSLRQHLYIDVDPAQIANGGKAFRKESPQGSLVLIGDSHASGLATMLRDRCSDQNWDFIALNDTGGDLSPGSDVMNDSLKVVEAEKPTMVVLAIDWIQVRWEADNAQLNVLRQMVEDSELLVIVASPPVIEIAGDREHLRASGVKNGRETDESNLSNIQLQLTLATWHVDDYMIIDPRSILDGEQLTYSLYDDGKPVWFDDSHLTSFSARKFVNSEFDDALFDSLEN